MVVLGGAYRPVQKLNIKLVILDCIWGEWGVMSQRYQYNGVTLVSPQETHGLYRLQGSLEKCHGMKYPPEYTTEKGRAAERNGWNMYLE